MRSATNPCPWPQATHRGAPPNALRQVVKRLGEPVIHSATIRAMKEMGRQFVLGENITSAMKRAAGMEDKDYTYSYDMLGEVARTEADAAQYHLAYSRAISAIAEACTSNDTVTAIAASVRVLHQGADNLSLYTCGSHTHHQRRSAPSECGINLGCFEGVNPRDLGEILWSDGVNHPSDR